MNTIERPSLTPYDTGGRLEPHSWTSRNQPKTSFEDYGKVDFDTEDGTTALTVHAERNGDGKDGGGYTLHIGNVGVDLAVKGDETVPLIQSPSAVLGEKVQRTISDLRTPIEQETAEVYWNGHEALILVPGEKHVRKQQIILVSEGGGVISAKVGPWGNGVRDTRIG
jgi:hypothetical protein